MEKNGTKDAKTMAGKQKKRSLPDTNESDVDVSNRRPKQGKYATVKTKKHQTVDDEDIISSSTKEHGTRSLEEESKKLRRGKEASELSSAQVEAKIKYPSSTNICRSYSIHPELVTKKNQPERIPNKEDIEDTIWKIFNGPDGDIRPLIESFRPNSDEPSCKSNCLRF